MIKVFVVFWRCTAQNSLPKNLWGGGQQAESLQLTHFIQRLRCSQSAPVTTVTLEPVHSCLSWDMWHIRRLPTSTLLRVSQGFILTWWSSYQILLSSLSFQNYEANPIPQSESSPLPALASFPLLFIRISPPNPDTLQKSLVCLILSWYLSFREPYKTVLYYYYLIWKVCFCV